MARSTGGARRARGAEDGDGGRNGGGSHGDGDGMRRKILRAIERHHRRLDQWPTYREIGAAVGVESTSHVAHHVAMLVKQGYLTHEPGISRGVALAGARAMASHERWACVRILGRIAAGAPLDLFETGEAELLDIGGAALAGSPAAEVYALRVVGDSMIEDGILSDDLVLVREGSSVTNGAIAVAVERSANGGQGAATVKRVSVAGDRVLLQPANAAYSTREIGAEDWDRDWMVQGTVIGVYRSFDRGFDRAPSQQVARGGAAHACY